MAGEFDRLGWLRSETARRRPPRGSGRAAAGGGRLLLGPGDDAALWAFRDGDAAVLTVDAQLEGIHFRRGWMSPEEIGARAVAASASDLAAMGAAPSGILFALALPPATEERFFRAIYRGVLREGRRLGLEVLGGNLSRGPLSLTVTSIGAVPRPGAALRRGGRPGDGLYVTGWPGRARLGRAILERGGAAASLARSRAGSLCLRAFRAPRARIEEGLFLRERRIPRALIDLSDGVAPDLGHLLEESARARRSRKLGAELDREAIGALLTQGGALALARWLRLDPLEAFLQGGEDYELLLAADPRKADQAAGEFQRRFNLPVTRIGTLTERRGILMSGEPVSLTGFDHFGPTRREKQD